MTSTSDTERPAVPRRRSRRGGAAVVLVPLDLAVVALPVLLGRVEVPTERGLGRVGFGRPLRWLTQDRVSDPPLPACVGLASPWKNPTSVDWLPLALDVVIVGLVLLGVWRVVRALGSRRAAS